MDLELSDDQRQLTDNFRSVLEDKCPPSVVRGIYENGHDGSELWKRMVELSWPALAIPEESGGLGYGFVEVGLLAEELGRAAAPATMLATVSQFTPFLIESDASDLLIEVAEGRLSGSLAFAERGRWSIDAVRTTATRQGDEWTLTGSKDAVLAGAVVDAFAVVAIDESSHEPGIFLVERSAARIESPDLIDPGLLMANVLLDGCTARALAAPSPAVRAIVERGAMQAQTAMTLHMAGACRQILETTLAYAKIRKQYGRVIGSFQALKHRFANMYLAVERATALAYYAAIAIEEDDPASAEATHLAKASAGDCQRLLAEDGLQLHGGLGFTWEQDLHFLLKRAKAGEMLCGSSAFHRAMLVSMLDLDRTGPAIAETTQSEIEVRP
jgi:alkylation response protein AidB-like acyl-CoA dehydrogenase